VRVGGNLGEPALDLLPPPATDAAQPDAAPDLYVLELSSFQLEATETLHLKAATVLNVTADHLDRYASVDAYAAAKARIYARCDTAVVNLDDPLVRDMPKAASRTLAFSLRADAGADFAVAERADAAGERWIMRREEPLLPLGALRIAGLHNVANALAALALGEALALPMPPMLTELAAFPGLPHRAQWVAEIGGVTYVNDSKGTNVGATLAAVGGMPGPPLAAAFKGKVRHAVLIGRDAGKIAAVLRGVCRTERAGSLEEAVRAAARAAKPGDSVLLSPACASLDMVRDYTHRGSVFAQAVKELET
jgi:UDP-N-acetylmuramoylalanine--D-glutamate ligase